MSDVDIVIAAAAALLILSIIHDLIARRAGRK